MSVKLYYKVNGKDVMRRASFDEEKALAVEMWEFVRYMMIVEDNVYDAEHWKRAFLDYKRECGVDIEWLDRCFLCDKCADCYACPLYDLGQDRPCGAETCDDEYDTPYGVVQNYSEHDIGEIDEAIDTIISAVKSLEE